MRVQALLPERRALPHPEAMLLVDDRQAEPLERDGLLDERVRADDHLELARGERVDDRASSRAGHARGEEGGPGGCRAGRRFARGGPCSRGPPTTFEELRERAVVLLREELRGRHERGLGARGDGDARGERRDDRLAGPHVALEEARHGDALREVGADLGERAALRARERERQRRDPAFCRGVVGAQRQRLGVPAPALAALAERQLEHEKLVEREPSPCREEVGPRRREVHLAEGVLDREQTPPLADLVGQRLGHLAHDGGPLRAAEHGGVEPAPEVSLLQAIRERVDGDDPSGMHRLRRGALDLRVRELEGAPEPLHLPREAHELALGVALLDELAAEPRRTDARRRAIRGIEELDLGHELPARGAALADVPEDRLDRLVVFGANAPDRREGGVVEIRPGQVP